MVVKLSDTPIATSAMFSPIKNSFLAPLTSVVIVLEIVLDYGGTFVF